MPPFDRLRVRLGRHTLECHPELQNDEGSKPTFRQFQAACSAGLSPSLCSGRHDFYNVVLNPFRDEGPKPTFRQFQAACSAGLNPSLRHPSTWCVDLTGLRAPSLPAPAGRSGQGDFFYPHQPSPLKGGVRRCVCGDSGCALCLAGLPVVGWDSRAPLLFRGGVGGRSACQPLPPFDRRYPPLISCQVSCIVAGI